MRKVVSVLAAGLLLPVASTVLAENTTYGTSAGSSLGSGDENVLIGDSAGASLSSGDQNTFVGQSAGATVNASSNVVIGYDAGATGSYYSTSVLIGTRAGYQFSGYYSALLGYEAGYSLTNQYRQTFVGSGAGYNDNFSGSYYYNTYVGYHAAYNVSDRENTAVGSEALYGNATTVTPAFSVALGYRAAYGVGNNDGNVALGEGAGYDLGDGGYNTLIGARAGESVQDNNNTANYYEFYASTMVGALVGLDSQSGAIGNTFMGAGAGSANQTGDYNVVIGAFADFADWSAFTESEIETVFLSDIGSGTGLTALDTNPRYNVLVGAWGQLSGNYATAVGYGVKSTGNNSVTVGSGATTSHTQAVTIGYGAASHADYTVVLGNESTTGWHPHADGVTSLGSSSYRFTQLYTQSLTAQADSGVAATMMLAADAATDSGDSWQFAAADSGDFSLSNDISGSQTALVSLNNGGDLTVTGDVTALSDRRFKKAIEPVERALDVVGRLAPKRYYWRPETGRDAHQHLGLIAQQVEQVLPEVVKQNGDGWKSVNYPALLPLLAQAGGELSERQQQQRDRMAALQGRLDAIEAALQSTGTGE